MGCCAWSRIKRSRVTQPSSSLPFGGWNDAGQSATDALEHLLDVWQSEEVIDLPGDDFYDYQFNRPEVSIGLDGDREVAWPGTTIFKAATDTLPDTKIFLVHGVEPSMRWKHFVPRFCHIELGERNVLITLGRVARRCRTH
jgi:hypothetical protein